jgi:hypothetical protein
MSTVLESIDRPIRALVINLNRIGLSTIFSCCGFNYAGQENEEDKSHSPHPFVIFKDPNTWPKIDNFMRFTRSAFQVGWTINRYSTSSWIIRYERGERKRQRWANDSENDGFWEKLPGKDYGLHDYELSSIAIYSLNKAIIDNNIPTINDEVELVDGNQTYHDLGIHWEIQPRPSAILKFISEAEENELELETVKLQ